MQMVINFKYLIVTVEGVKCHCALAHVNKTLSDAHHEEVVRVLGVVLCQLEHLKRKNIIKSLFNCKIFG